MAPTSFSTHSLAPPSSAQGPPLVARRGFAAKPHSVSWVRNMHRSAALTPRTTQRSGSGQTYHLCGQRAGSQGMRPSIPLVHRVLEDFFGVHTASARRTRVGGGGAGELDLARFTVLPFGGWVRWATHLAARTSQLCHDNLHPHRAARSAITASLPVSARRRLVSSCLTVSSMVCPQSVA